MNIVSQDRIFLLIDSGISSGYHQIITFFVLESSSQVHKYHVYRRIQVLMINFNKFVTWDERKDVYSSQENFQEWLVSSVDVQHEFTRMKYHSSASE